MNRILPSIRIQLAIAVLLSCKGALAESPLAERLAPVFDAEQFEHAIWGALVVDAASGETLYERNPDKLFVPASTTKLYSSAAALDALGAEHKFVTPVYARTSQGADGAEKTDLILVASGDPTLGGRTDSQGQVEFRDSDHTYADFSDTAEVTAANPLAGLFELARQVAAAGVTRVDGEVLIDDRLFAAESTTGSGPKRLTAIMVNDNVIDLVIAPGKANEPANIVWRPGSAALAVDSRVETIAAGGETRVAARWAGAGRVVLEGQIAADRQPLTRAIEVEDPASWARTLFIECLRSSGVSVTASALDSHPAGRLPPPEDYAQARQVAKFESPPLGEHIKLILKVSHNLHASACPMWIAPGNPKSLAAGLRAQHEFLARAGVDVGSISFGGGAGGDPADRVTPRATVRLLQYMATRPDFPTYKKALPRLGVDGTLAKSVTPESPARDRAQAKTGTLLYPNVMNGRYLLTSKALAGYLQTASGREVIFAMFVNDVDIAKATDRDRIGQVLGRACEVICADR